MRKTLIILAEGFEEIEALTVVDVMRRADVVCDICTLSDEYVNGAHDIVVKADLAIEDVNPKEYDAIILPGGMPGSRYLKESNSVLELIKTFNNSKKVIAAICAAPIVLEEAGILKNKVVTSYPNSLKDDGDHNYVEEIVACDDNIITSRGPATSLAFAYAILEKLGLGDKANALKEGMMVNFYNSKQK